MSKAATTSPTKTIVTGPVMQMWKMQVLPRRRFVGSAWSMTSRFLFIKEIDHDVSYIRYSILRVRSTSIIDWWSFLREQKTNINNNTVDEKTENQVLYRGCEKI